VDKIKAQVKTLYHEGRKIFLKHIFDSINQIEEYLNGVDFENFIKRKLIQDGVIRQLEIIGEATKHLFS